MRYLLNSAVVTAEGVYTYRRITLAEAVGWLRAGDWVSRIGYPQNAAVIERLCGRHCPVSREPVTMAPGDEALIMRLPYRVSDPATKGAAVDVPDDAWEWGLMRAVSLAVCVRGDELTWAWASIHDVSAGPAPAEWFRARRRDDSLPWPKVSVDAPVVLIDTRGGVRIA